MEFLVSEIYEKTDLYAFTNAVKMRNKKPIHTFYRFVIAIMFLLTQFLIIYSMTVFIRAIKYASALRKVYLIIMVVIGLLLIAYSVYRLVVIITDRPFLSERRCWKNYSNKGQTITYRFGDDRFEEHMEQSDHSYEYSIVESVYEDKKRFYLFVNRQSAHIIRKEDFRHGAPDDFRAFIEEKTGLRVQTIK